LAQKGSMDYDTCIVLFRDAIERNDRKRSNALGYFISNATINQRLMTYSEKKEMINNMYLDYKYHFLESPDEKDDQQPRKDIQVIFKDSDSKEE
jgi:hypothetical protein